MGIQLSDMTNKEQILHAFQRLFSEYQQTTSGVKTKQETAERGVDKHIVETAKRYKAVLLCEFAGD